MRKGNWVDPRFRTKKPQPAQPQCQEQRPVYQKRAPPPRAGPSGYGQYSGASSRPQTEQATTKVVVQSRPPQAPSGSGSRMAYRQGPSAAPCPPEPCPSQAPQMASRLRPPHASGLRPPQGSGLRAPQASGLRQPQTAPCPMMPPQARGLRPPQGYGMRPPQASGLRPPQGMMGPPQAEPCQVRPPTTGLRAPRAGGLRPPQSRMGVPQASRSSRPRSPCFQSDSGLAAAPAPQVSTPQRSTLRSCLRRGPSSRSLGRSVSFKTSPQKIVLLPGDIDPTETTVITVEPPPPSGGDIDEFDFFNTQPQAQEPYQPQPMEQSTGLLIDVGPYDPCEERPQVNIEPVDLITLSPPDPFSPDRTAYSRRPMSPSVSPPPHPFSPPVNPIPEPSALNKWYSQYPHHREAFAAPSHPILDYSRMRRERPPPDTRTPVFVDREVVARSVPHNRQVSTICRDDDEDDELGLLPDFGDEFNAPLNYDAIRQEEEQRRETRRQAKMERERQERGPTLQQTMDMLSRIRAREEGRRREMTAEFITPLCDQPNTMQDARAAYQRVMDMAGNAGGGMPCAAPSAPVCGPLREDLRDIQMDAIDLEAFEDPYASMVDLDTAQSGSGLCPESYENIADIQMDFDDFDLCE